MPKEGEKPRKPKRQYGKGVSIYFNTGQNRWQCDITLPDGRRTTVVGPVGVTKYKDVDGKFEQAIAEVKSGKWVAPSTQTVGEYTRKWVESKKASLKASVYPTWKSFIKCHIAHDLDRWQLQKLTPEIIQSWVDDQLKEKDLANISIFKIYDLLRYILEEAVELKILSSNPCHHIRLPRVEEEEMQVLDEDQARTLIDWLAKNQHRYEALLVLVLTTGMRRGEVTSLKWSDFVFEKAEVTVQRTVFYVPTEGFVVNEPKTKRSRRKLLLTKEVIDTLQTHRKRQLEIRLKAGGEWKNKDLVFCNEVGEFLNPKGLDGAFKRLLEYAGLPEIRFHDLRHTAATLMLLAGASLKEVQEYLGHSSIQTTMRYAHVLPVMQKTTTERLGNRLFKRA